jgi:hypothetical protein
MIKINLKLRTKYNREFCNVIERGKCCYRLQKSNGLCDYHIPIFIIFYTDLSKLKPKLKIRIDYDINFIAPKDKCRIFEKSQNAKKLIACTNLAHKKGICQKHSQILNFFGVSNDFEISQ